jgi:hypothetical protein
MIAQRFVFVGALHEWVFGLQGCCWPLLHEHELLLSSEWLLDSGRLSGSLLTWMFLLC